MVEDREAIDDKINRRQFFKKAVKITVGTAGVIAAAGILDNVIPNHPIISALDSLTKQLFLPRENQSSTSTTTQPSSTSTPENDFKKLLEEYPELGQNFTESNYKSALMYKAKFPQVFTDTDFHEHMNRRIIYEDKFITNLGGD